MLIFAKAFLCSAFLFPFRIIFKYSRYYCCIFFASSSDTLPFLISLRKVVGSVISEKLCVALLSIVTYFRSL